MDGTSVHVPGIKTQLGFKYLYYVLVLVFMVCYRLIQQNTETQTVNENYSDECKREGLLHFHGIILTITESLVDKNEGFIWKQEITRTVSHHNEKLRTYIFVVVQ